VPRFNDRGTALVVPLEAGQLEGLAQCGFAFTVIKL
jgi:hypothetical protein